MAPVVLLIGLDPPETDLLTADLKSRRPGPVVCHPTLPRILVRGGELFVESTSGARLLPVEKVVYHGIFEDDHDTLAGLALWGGPCLPNAAAMMDCRLKLPCLARALRYTAFGAPARGFASAGVAVPAGEPAVAKWGNWHCGENKVRFDAIYTPTENCVIEPFLNGEAVRVLQLGERVWQIRLAGDDWLKSVHHAAAEFMPVDPRLEADVRRVGAGFGLTVLANDYILSPDGTPHLLETNHIPNVTRFPTIREAYRTFVLDWLCAEPAGPKA
ncbi:hypothetical protein [Alienimonas chondri]|uniref:ATP-grasp domain-containing protein n=1 Tax=Alienimonas chondri TaxID=2681879 RepID=A0ABX1VGE4_9PLAN|nr:hypothetical protein [Alienimonas chondri]NNJ27175.1 hypothetical protein [Alienimonas chondri]